MIEIIEKKSKFITYAFILNSEGQVDEILSSLRKEHKKATHICYAYNFSELNNIVHIEIFNF